MTDQADNIQTPARTGARARPSRARLVGVVTSAKPNKTIRVEVAYRTPHPKYGKYVRRRTVIHAHDENNQAREGDRVEVMACRPVSKTKSWRLVRVIDVRGEEAPGGEESGA